MRNVWLLVGFAAIAVPAWSDAQVLHEPVTVGVLHCDKGVCTNAAGRISAVVDHGQLLRAPTGDAQPKPGEQIFSPQPETPVDVGGSGAGSTSRPLTGPSAPPSFGGGPAPDRRDVIHTDRDTGPEAPGEHPYHMVFDPEPYPFKRMTALDDVRIQPCADGRPGCDDEVLMVHDRERHQLGMTSPEPGRDLFWGSIVVDFEPGRLVPIPSVSADSEILEARTEPPVPVTFWKDGADNFFVMSTAGGRHRLIWLSDAPRSYFGGELPATARLGDMPPELLRTLPARLRARAQKVLAHIGITHVTKSSSLKSVLDPLVGYFRAFEVGELPPSTGSSYLDLAMNQKGCCRHRSYAFAITAMALGIPVRYIENELHVYVEVFVPRVGWRRINLGGAPIEERLYGGEGKTLYQEHGADPFPQPRAFAEAAAPRPKGLPPQVTHESAPSTSSGAARASDGNGGTGGGASSGNASASGSASSSKIDLAALDSAAQKDEQLRPKPRARTSISVELGARTSYRGDSVEVSGQVRADGADAGALPVEIYLDGAAGALRVGETVTDAAGRWRAVVEVPRDVSVGDYHVVARTRGDDRRAAASTRSSR